MLHLFTCHGRIMPRLAELLLSYLERLIYDKTYMLHACPGIQGFYTSVCINGSLGVRDSQILPWDFLKSMPGSSGVPMIRWYRLAACWKLPIPIID